MIQDIKPHIFNNEYKHRKATDGDFVFIYHAGQAFVNEKNQLPKLGELAAGFDDLTYLFCVDGIGFYLAKTNIIDGTYVPVQNLYRAIEPKWLAFAAATCGHLAVWYEDNQFCGKCAVGTVMSESERALTCPACGLIKYPSIAPVVIVGITKGDEILLTKYAKGHTRYALVAGFVEIGETLEDAVKREVMEEVGLRVKNISYYKSQPWAISQSLLMGFYCELDCPDTITLDQNELSEATWFHKNDIPKDEEDRHLSLTRDMIENFRV